MDSNHTGDAKLELPPSTDNLARDEEDDGPVREITVGKPRFKYRHTYMKLQAFGFRKISLAAKGEPPPEFPAYRRAAVAKFQFSPAVTLLGGQTYWACLWESGKCYAKTAFVLTGDDSPLDQIDVLIARPGLRSVRCWLTVEEGKDDCTTVRRSGTLLLKG